MLFTTREEIIAMTPLWKGERFEDGRPKVADKYLDALYGMTLEELWKPIFVKGYESNFIAMKSLHPEFKENGELNRPDPTMRRPCLPWPRNRACPARPISG